MIEPAASRKQTLSTAAMLDQPVYQQPDQVTRQIAPPSKRQFPPPMAGTVDDVRKAFQKIDGTGKKAALVFYGSAQFTMDGAATGAARVADAVRKLGHMALVVDPPHAAASNWGSHIDGIICQNGLTVQTGAGIETNHGFFTDVERLNLPDKAMVRVHAEFRPEFVYMVYPCMRNPPTVYSHYSDAYRLDQIGDPTKVAPALAWLFEEKEEPDEDMDDEEIVHV